MLEGAPGMLSLSPRLPVGKVGGGGHKEERTLCRPCQRPELEGKTCALGTRSSILLGDPFYRVEGKASTWPASPGRGALNLCWTLTHWGKGGSHIQTGTVINLLVRRVVPDTAPPSQPLRLVPSPAAYQVGQLGKERGVGGENDRGSHT